MVRKLVTEGVIEPSVPNELQLIRRAPVRRASRKPVK
jgi:hypothetical protein